MILENDMDALDLRLVPPIKSLVHDLVLKNYADIEADGRSGRLSANDIQRVIEDYGRTLIDLPESGYANHIEVYALDGYSDRWVVDIDLFTVEEGRSDLTLSVEMFIQEDAVMIEISDLHVL